MGACGGCARPMPDAAVRCMYCGQAKAPPKECPKCKRKLDPFATKCVFCAIELAPPSKGPDPRAVTLARGEMFQHAEKLRRAGQIDNAMFVLDQVIIADPTFVPAFIARGKCFAASSDFLGARDAAASALALDPRHAEALSLHETWSRAAGGANEEETTNRAKKAHVLAHEALDSGRPREALELFDLLVSHLKPEARDAPENATLHNSRGVALQRVGRLLEALASFDEALRVNRKYAFAWQNRASTLDDLGRVKEAAEDVTRAIQIDPKNASFRVDLGVYRDKLGELDAAVAAYDAAIAIDPKHVLAHFNLGNTRHKSGDSGGAERAYRAALAIHPDFEPVKEALERLLTRRR